MSVSKYSVKHPTMMLILFLVLTALGVYSATSLPLDLMPEMNIPYVLVSTTYTNASPSEVEEKVTETLESSLSGISGLKHITSTSSKGSSMIMLEFTTDTNMSEATGTIRDRIDMVRGYLPDDADSPTIMKIDLNMMPIIVLAMSSDDMSAEELRTLGNDTVKPRLQQLDGVASVSVMGGRERAVRVEVSKENLAAMDLSITSVGQMIAAQNVNTAIGSIVENGLDWSITTDGTYDTIDQIGDVVVAYKPDATGTVHRVLLKDIATITDSFKDPTSNAYVNGKPSVALMVTKTSGSNTVGVVHSVRAALPEIEGMIPNSVKISEAYNSSDTIEESIASVAESLYEGILLAVIVLFLFLANFKSTLIIALAIPTSLCITLGAMYFSGLTLNLMTLAGLTLGVGMLVDNSIVVLENIFNYRQRGTKITVASILGSEEMIMSIIGSTLTSICVYLPMLMYGRELGLIGDVFKGLAFTICFSLTCSLLVAMMLVPVLTSKYLKLGDLRKRNLLQRGVDAFQEKMDNAYGAIVRFNLHHKILFLGILAALAFVTIQAGTKVGFNYMPESIENQMSISIELPQGTALEETDKVITGFMDLLADNIKGTKIMMGTAGSGMMTMGSSGSYIGSIYVMFPSSKEAQPGDDTVTTTKRKLPELAKQFPQATITVNNSQSAGSSSSGMKLKIKSSNLDLARETSRKVLDVLNAQAGDYIYDIESDLKEGLPEAQIVYDRERMYMLGLTVSGVNAELRAQVNGTTFGRISLGSDDVDIVVSTPKSENTRLMDLDSLEVTTSSGAKVPLSSFAHYEETRSPLSIAREDQSFIVTITGQWQPGVAVSTAQGAIDKLIDENIPLTDDLLIEAGGDYDDMMTAISVFIKIITVAIILVYAVMASQFESFLKPFIIFFTIPLALIGVVWIYLLMGSTFNVITVVGLLVLVGTIVNNGIVLVDYTGLLQRRGYNIEEACVRAAKSRLRPILMSTLTTVLALIPMAFNSGEGSAQMQPIGQTVLGGMTFGSAMTLLLMPVLYYTFFKGAEKRRNKRLQKERQQLETDFANASMLAKGEETK